MISPETYIIIVGLLSLIIWRCYGLIQRDSVSIKPVAYDQIVASLQDAVLVLNLRHHIIGFNPAAQRLLAVERAALMNQSLNSVLRLPDDTPLSGDASAEFEHLVGTLMCEVNSLPLISNQAVIGRILVLRDITPRKQAEREAMELALVRERAQIRMLFIRNASHEFRTPITVIKTTLYLLSRQTDPDKRAKQVLTIETQIGRLSHLIDDLQKMSVLDGTPDFHRTVADLNPLVYAAWEQAEADVTGRIMRVTLSKSPLLYAFDPYEFKQALIRLIDNAIRYSPPESEIHLSTVREGVNACIKIQDHGIGMDAKTLKKATQRFYRNDSAHSTAGFGLGLPIAKTIIELHGGGLTLESVVGQGTTVTIQLPLSVQSIPETVDDFIPQTM